MKVPPNRIQTLWSNNRKWRKTDSPLPTDNSSKQNKKQLLSRDIILLWLPILKWWWGGMDAFLVPKLPGLAMLSQLVLNHWSRLWPGNSTTEKIDESELAQTWNPHFLHVLWKTVKYRRKSCIYLHGYRMCMYMRESASVRAENY